MSYDLVDGQAEAYGETRADRQAGADGQATDSLRQDSISASRMRTPRSMITTLMSMSTFTWEL